MNKADPEEIQVYAVPGEQGPPDQEEDEHGEEDMEEARAVKTGRSPCEPTPEERRLHEVAHIPYRAWCPHCARGRKRNIQHFKAPEVDGSVRQISLDFFFLGEDGTQGTVPCVCAKERASKVHFAYVIAGKGGDEETTAERLAQDFINIGLNKEAIILKGDQEPAISSLLRNIKERLPGAMEERSPVGESCSNGDVDRGIQSVENIARTLKLALEQRLSTKIPVTHPVVTWLVPHAAFLFTRIHVSADGRTGYERLKGKTYRGELLELCSKVLFRLPGKKRGGSMEAGWDYGIWLGKDSKTDEHILWSAGKVVRSHGVQQLPPEQTWDTVMVDQVRVMQWAPDMEHEEKEPIFRKLDPEMEEPKPQNPEPIPRGTMIFKKHLEKFGFTPGCRKCTAILENRNVHPTLGHSPECRKRILEEMAKDEDFKFKVEAADKRKREYEEAVAAKRSRGTGPREPSVSPPPQQQLPREHAASSSSSGFSRSQTSATTQDSDGPGAPGVPGQNGRKREDDAEDPAEKGRANKKARPEESAPKQVREREGQCREPDPKRKRGLHTDTTSSEESSSDTSSTDDEEEEVPAISFMQAQPQQQQQQMGTSQWDIAEIFSPPRLTATAEKQGFTKGCAFDLNAPCPLTGRTWDFLCAADRKEAIRMIKREKPKFIMGSPPCEQYSQLVNLNPHRQSVEFKKAKAQADILLDFAMEVYELQMRGGRYFAHEHPSYATSWTMPSVEKLLAMPSVGTVALDMCQYGMIARDSKGEAPALKPTKIMSNCEAILNGMNRRCRGGGSSTCKPVGWSC